jgi:hypothetical protein
MLKFDKSHKSIDGNIDKKKGAISVKKIVALGFAVLGLIFFSGCAKDVPCDIEGVHAHLYVGSDHFSRYIISEKDSVSWLRRQDEYIFVKDEEEVKKLNFLNREGLFLIEDNKEAIEEKNELCKYYVEYEYRYPTRKFKYERMYIDGEYHLVGRWVDDTDTDYTTDVHKANLTGNRRLTYPTYEAYKIVQDEEGRYKAVRSDTYNDFNEIPSEFNYIKSNYVSINRSYHPYIIDKYIDEQVAKAAAIIEAQGGMTH